MSYVVAVVPPAMAVALQKLVDVHNDLKIADQLVLIAELENMIEIHRKVADNA